MRGKVTDGSDGTRLGGVRSLGFPAVFPRGSRTAATPSGREAVPVVAGNARTSQPRPAGRSVEIVDNHDEVHQTTKEGLMPGWTPDELTKIGQADELELASLRREGSLRNPVTMWVIRDGDQLYVRSMHGRSGAWFRGTQTRLRGHIRAGGIDKDVAFIVDTDAAVNDRIDEAYRSKYRRYGTNIVGGVVNPRSRASTIKLVPR
jgi:hypothetical protein